MLLLSLTSEPPAPNNANYGLLLVLTSQKPAILISEIVTSTAILQLPINAVLGDQQDYEQGDTEIEAKDPNIRTQVTVLSGGGRLSSNESSFRVRKDNRGYD